MHLPSSSSLHDPDKTHFGAQDNTKRALSKLLEDAICLHDILYILLNVFKNAACLVDKRGDLPIHLLSRQLWNWNYRLRQHFHLQEPQNRGELRRVMEDVSLKLGDCCDLLLKPLIGLRILCCARG